MVEGEASYSDIEEYLGILQGDVEFEHACNHW
jgi:hypothetical protein